jgi:hypothetical protein
MSRAPYPSTDDPTFRSSVERWIADNGEVLAVIRFAGGAGSKSFEFFQSIEAFTRRVEELPTAASVTVLAEHQLPLRGLVDDEFIERARSTIRDGHEWLIVCLEKITMGAASWFHDYDGNSHEELAAELRDEFCYGKLVAVGLAPEWLHDSSTVITAITPNADGTVTVGVY